MSAYVGGTVIGGIGDLAERQFYEFPAPTAEERALYHAQTEERLRQQRIERERYIEECKANFPIEGMSGDFDTENDSMNVWRIESEYPHADAKFVVAECDFCHTTNSVLEVANASDEYDYVNACHSCLTKMFEAHSKEVYG